NWISWNAVCGESRTYWCEQGEKGAITSNPYLSVSIRQIKNRFLNVQEIDFLIENFGGTPLRYISVFSGKKFRKFKLGNLRLITYLLKYYVIFKGKLVT
ncbi:hypothetical protein ACWF5S_29925, partial [Peribacillus butanolivorans]